MYGELYINQLEKEKEKRELLAKIVNEFSGKLLGFSAEECNHIFKEVQFLIMKKRG